MRLRLLYRFSCFFPSFLIPQTFPIPQNRAGTAALSSSCEAAYQSSKTLSATFLERYFENGRLLRADAGVAYFAKPGKMRWEYVSPEQNLYIIDGKWSWFYVPADHTVTRIPAKQSSDARKPFALLTGQMRVSKVCKSVEFDRSGVLEKVRGEVLRCNFRGGNGESDSIPDHSVNSAARQNSFALFELDPSNGQLLRVRFVEPGGVQVEFQFTGWAFNPPVEAAKFRFQSQKGVAIVNGDLGAASNSE